MNQKGMAYILVLVLGGIIAISGLVFYSSIIIESRVSTNTRLSKNVFYQSEGNIALSLTDLKTGGNPPFIFNPTEVKQILNLANNTVFSKNKFTSQDGKYSSDIQYFCTDRSDVQDIYDEENQTLLTGQRIDSNLTITSKSFLVRNNNRLLPQTVEMKVKVTQSRGMLETNFPGFNSAISTGGTLTFDGNPTIYGGSAFSNGILDLGSSPSQLRIVGGEAYSAGKINGTGIIIPRIVDGQPLLALNPKQDPLIFKTPAWSYYKEIADYKFYTSQIFNEWKPIWEDKPVKDGQVVIYIEGDLVIKKDFINLLPALLVVTGSVEIKGGADVGEGSIPFGIIAGGAFQKEAGGGNMNGFFYATGSIDLKGDFTLKGAIAANQSISLKGGANKDGSIIYDKSLSAGLNLVIYPESKSWDVWTVSGIIKENWANPVK